MLNPGQPGLDRHDAVRIVEELPRLQSSDTRHRGFVDQLRQLLDTVTDQKT